MHTCDDGDDGSTDDDDDAAADAAAVEAAPQADTRANMPTSALIPIATASCCTYRLKFNGHPRRTGAVTTSRPAAAWQRQLPQMQCTASCSLSVGSLSAISGCCCAHTSSVPLGNRQDCACNRPCEWTAVNGRERQQFSPYWPRMTGIGLVLRIWLWLTNTFIKGWTIQDIFAEQTY